MATALYRRYRPDSFEDVIGQEHVTHALETALSTSRVAHAYLFSGPRGCGKTTSARILARSLNCAEGPTPTPCGSCESCIELASGGPGNLDVVEIDAASHGGVDDARELRERLTFAPTRDRYRIFILDEAHMVSNQGFNALLKAVEEPPPHVKFIFATTEPDKVIATIRSRTHHYPFRLVPPNILTPYLKTICAREGVELDDSVLALVVRAGGGSVRDSLSVLDQLIAGSEGKVTHEEAVRLLGYTDSALLDRIIDALGRNDGAAAFDEVSELVEAGVDPHQFVEDLLHRLRDLMVCALAGDRAEDILAEVPADQYASMQRQAAQWGSGLLSRRADIVENALREMSGATAPRLQLELLLARLLIEEPADPVSESASSPRGIPAAEAHDPQPRRMGDSTPGRPVSSSLPTTQGFSGADSPQAEPVSPAAQGAPDLAEQVVSAPTDPTEISPASAVPTTLGVRRGVPAAETGDMAAAPSKDEVRQQWRAILGILGTHSAMLPSLMQAVRDVSSEGNTVVFHMREQMDADRFIRANGEELLAQALSEVFEKPLKASVGALGGAALPPRDEPRPAVPDVPPNPAEIEEEPNDDSHVDPQVSASSVVYERPDSKEDLQPDSTSVAPPRSVDGTPGTDAQTKALPDESRGSKYGSQASEPTVVGAASDAEAVSAPDLPTSDEPYGAVFSQSKQAAWHPSERQPVVRESQAVSGASPEEDSDERYRGRSAADLVTDILGGQVIEEVIEDPRAE